jgi:ribosomal protein S17E
MSISKRLLKKRKAKTYKWANGYLGYLLRGNNFDALINIEISKVRIRKKLIKTYDINALESFLSARWSVPIVVTNPSKRSRIKNYIRGYTISKAEKITKYNGEPYTDAELWNIYIAIGK